MDGIHRKYLFHMNFYFTGIVCHIFSGYYISIDIGYSKKYLLYLKFPPKILYININLPQYSRIEVCLTYIFISLLFRN